MATISFRGTVSELIAHVLTEKIGHCTCDFSVSITPVPAPIVSLHDAALAAMRPHVTDGAKIQAIKAVRTVAQDHKLGSTDPESGLDLYELRNAKDFVEKHWAELL